MSDVEEPPTKVAKLELSQTFTQPEAMEEMHEEGQEEWLSEGLLTDDDTVSQPNPHESTAQSQDTTMETQETQETTVTQETQETIQEANDKIDANIEQTLNSMDNSQAQSNDPFDALLTEKAPKKDQTDGNDTDDLLRMLEDDDKSKKKVLTKTKNKEPTKEDNASSDDDDDAFIYQGTTVKKLKVAKNAIIQKYPAKKAMPETDDDETDASADDVKAMQKMFHNKPTPARPYSLSQSQLQIKKQFVPKKVVRVGNSNTFRKIVDKRPVTSPLPRAAPAKPLLKTQLGGEQSDDKRPELKKLQTEHDEIINEEEFLEEDCFDLDEDFAEELDAELENRKNKQRIMRPEQMDEDMLSDAESNSEDDSLYDELPSSDSDDMDEWFTLDVRAERAGDYLPLLGSRAYELLAQEKVRVSTRVRALRHSLASLGAGSAAQAERLKAAEHNLAEITDMLKAH